MRIAYGESEDEHTQKAIPYAGAMFAVDQRFRNTPPDRTQHEHAPPVWPLQAPAASARRCDGIWLGACCLGMARS
jgi:hypothetical protein